MLWTIIVILLVLWLLGLIGNIGGGLIWLLLVIAAIVLLFQLLIGYAGPAVSSREPFRFLHTGDLHLDSPVEGLSAEAPPEVLALLRSATTLAWRNIVAAALENRVDFVVIAGDVFDVRSPTLLG